MAKITAAEVNKLRKQTGVGMMDCKKALVESDGDFDKAIDILRKKGQKLAVKRSDKDANEGVVLAKVNENKNFVAILMLNCETDFVAKNQEFIDISDRILNLALANSVKSKEELLNLKLTDVSVQDAITEFIGKIGEKIELAHYDFVSAAKVFAYNHQGNRLATALGFNKVDSQDIDIIGHEVAMQIAAMNPVAIDKDDVSPNVLEHEISLGKEMALQEGKPEDLAEKIAYGRLNKFYKENTLLNQDFVQDTKLSVRDYINANDKDLKVTAFKRLMLGA